MNFSKRLLTNKQLFCNTLNSQIFFLCEIAVSILIIYINFSALHSHVFVWFIIESPPVTDHIEDSIYENGVYIYLNFERIRGTEEPSMHI